MVVIDRADATLRHLARYWETFRQEGDPQRSPAIAALEAVLYEGRAVRIHVIYDGPATVGGRLIPGVREQFATVILARVSAGAWQRLAPIVDPAPKSSARLGRVHVVQTTAPTGSGAADDRCRSRRLAQCLFLIPGFESLWRLGWRGVRGRQASSLLPRPTLRH
ncbi:hypothetical protein [Streptomyces sp. NRRL B-3648]|uniref:hypothetical protein n=1 Tax=Streptomyces sp. NRRL B-3648 TaxID=1519493 RepID=UPI00131A689D|nr:hypothetical protein [Streptomyces sp. NRRL B-3648]